MGEGRGGRKGEPGKVGEEMEGEGRVEGWGGGWEIDVEYSIKFVQPVYIAPFSGHSQILSLSPVLYSCEIYKVRVKGPEMRLQCTVM